MYQLLIVDDESIVRTSLAALVDWEAMGFFIAGNVSTGKAALNLAQTQPIDLVLTDIKMPVMDGLELIEQLQQLPNPPVTVVLSAYSDFSLVRRAFRLGALDYVVKSDVTAAQMAELIQVVRPALEQRGSSAASLQPSRVTPAQQLRQLVLGEKPEEAFFPEPYLLACVEIDHFKKESLRLGGDLATTLVQPFLALAQQVPRVNARCVLAEVSAARYLLLYRGGPEEAVSQLLSICSQLQKVWKDYLNLSVTIGLSEVGEGAADFTHCLAQAGDNLTCAFVFGQGGIYGPGVAQLFDLRQARSRWQDYAPLCNAMRVGHTAGLLESQQQLFAELRRRTLTETRTVILEVVYYTALMMADAGVSLWEVFNTQAELDFYQQVQRLDGHGAAELWLAGFVRWVTDYLLGASSSEAVDLMDKAKRFIAENYADPNLSLTAVAGYVALNDKYFSTRFNKETGSSFTAYLTGIRLSMARQMILKTDMKMYEISDAVGFSNVEHFTRVFKKEMGASPLSLRKGQP